MAVSWDVDYDGSVEPDAATPAWTLDGDDYASSDGDILTIDTTGTSEAATSYRHQTEGQYWRDNVSNVTGWTIEVKMQVVTSADTDGRLALKVNDNVRFAGIRWSTSEIQLENWDDDPIYEMDTTDDYHVYRMTGVGTALKIYVDSVLRIDSLSAANVAYAMQWGDLNDGAGDVSKSYWDYVKYYCGGAEVPPTYDSKSLVARGIVLKTGSKNL